MWGRWAFVHEDREKGHSPIKSILKESLLSSSGPSVYVPQFPPRGFELLLLLFET